MSNDELRMSNGRMKGKTPKKSTFGIRNSKLKRSLVVTIDGPAGVGKSTVAKMVAKRLGLLYLDTGATYRTLAYAALQANLNPITDARRVAALGRRLPIELTYNAQRGLRVRLSGKDITKKIRTEEVTEAAAQVSQEPAVRSAMVALQRCLANPRPDPLGRGGHQGVVVEGRDTGSVVFPRARFKFFLDADPTVRAKRRQLEMGHLYGTKPPIIQVEEQLHFRDHLDRNRRVGPLRKPSGAVTIDTTHLTIPQVVRAMLERIAQRSG